MQTMELIKIFYGELKSIEPQIACGELAPASYFDKIL